MTNKPHPNPGYPDTDTRFFLPKLKLSPIDAIDEAAQAYPGLTDSEISAKQASDRAKLKPKPATKPSTKKISVT